MIASVHFRPWDSVVLAGYLVALAVAGVYFSRRNRTTEDYFLGGRSFPGWAIGISMIGTSISSVTFLALPAAAFTLDWRQLVPNLMLPFAVLMAIIVFIPLFRRSNLTSAFEYLEARFGPLARLYGSLGFILLQVIRLGTVLYLAALPVSLLTGLSTPWVIVVGGVVIAAYTVLGGIRAVIWTDVAQSIILICGGVVCFLFIVVALPGGIGQVFHTGMEHHKFSVGDMRWDFSERTFWVMAFVGLFSFLNEYSGNQNVIQRYLAAGSMREARKAAAVCAAVSVPIWTFFFLLGTALFVFYLRFPEPAVAGLKSDEVLPHFILTRIPAGAAGLIVAAILAAAMSSLDSSINAVATVTIVDLFKRYLTPGRDDGFYLRLAWMIATAAAVLMILGALVIHRLAASGSVEGMMDLGFILTSVFGGCLTGLFLVGFFTRRVDYRTVMAALVAGILLNVYLVLCSFELLPGWMSVSVHEYSVGVLTNIAFMVLAYLIALGRRQPPLALGGLTVWSMTSPDE